MKLMDYATDQFNTLVAQLAKVEQATTGAAEFTDLMKRIAKGSLRLGPMEIADTRIVTDATSQEFFDDGDKKVVGLRALAEGSLAKNQFFLPVGMQVLGFYDGTTPLTEDIALTKTFLPLSALNNGMGIENGEVTVRYEDSAIVKNMSMHLFDTAGRNDLYKGMLPIGPSEIIKEEQKLEVNIKFAYKVPANIAVQVRFVGVGTYARSNS